MRSHIDEGALSAEVLSLLDRMSGLKTILDTHMHAGFIDFDGAPSGLAEAMRYPLLAGGKRIRPVLAMMVAVALGHTAGSVLPLAMGIECLHTYSLVHDDLPSMDDDDLRRGRPTTHKVFGEDVAVLVGDALLTEAFRLVAVGQTCASDESRVALVSEFADAVGHRGMIAGQYRDMAAGEAAALSEIADTHDLKTGALFAFSAISPAVAFAEDPEGREALRDFGTALGLLFQITDDIIDETASVEQLGKTPGKDAAQGKVTYVGLLGLEGARAEALRVSDMARRALDCIPFGAMGAQAEAAAARQDLYALPELVLGRLS